MTGYGRAEVSKHGITAVVEVRSVNSRFLDVTTRMPRSLSQREKDIKDLIRTMLNRGSLNVTVRIERDSNGSVPLKINKTAARAYFRLLNELRKAVKLREQVKLEHLLNFSEVLEPAEAEDTDTREWEVVEQGVRESLRSLNEMRAKEGAELAKDLRQRVEWITGVLEEIEKRSIARVPEERKRLQERIAQLVDDKTIIDQNRLELEIALLSDKLDVTEECVRYRSHNKFFLEALDRGEAAGRKLNFLIQEMNREANTIGSKTNDAEIAHIVVRVKEELERIREQIQNIE
jgi:uncharacterized protein (TIGR00255 family)